MNGEEVKALVTRRVHAIADGIDWPHLTIAQRQRYYEQWTADPLIGGLLAQVVDPEGVRVYLKDTVIRSYLLRQRPEIKNLLEALTIRYDRVTREYMKPQAVLCDGVHLYTLTSAKDWKVSIVNAFERGVEIRGIRRNVVFIVEHTTGRFVDSSYRSLIESVARRLEVEVQWVT